MKAIDDGVAFAALGVAAVEVVKIYMDTAPSLTDLRCAPVNDYESRQLILDADIYGLIIVVALGGGGAIMVRRWYPLLLALAVLLMVSGWHHAVLNSDNRHMIKGE